MLLRTTHTGKPLFLYNTMTGQRETFIRNKEETITMYTCGPTVYKPTHIGHIVGPIIFDTLKRYLTFLGYNVKWVLNITDVDDKIIEVAKEQKADVKTLTDSMLADYQTALKNVNVTGIDKMPRVTDHIPQIVDTIKKLTDRGLAYHTKTGVYYDTKKFLGYGQLSNRENIISLVETSHDKKNSSDFALWKTSKDDEPKEFRFGSPFGCGRPGWHIECSCMLKEAFGDTVDIHGGGLDLKFPHHENEIAQSEVLTSRQLARVWMHHGLIKINSMKMSGSLGNYIRVSDLILKYPGDVLRLYILSTHYRSPFDIGTVTNGIPSALVSTATSYNTIVRLGERIKSITGKNFRDCEFTAPTADFEDIQHRFLEYLNNDFNTGGAVGIVYELCDRMNRLADKYKLNTNTAESSGEFLQGITVFKLMMNLLGLTLNAPTKPEPTPVPLGSYSVDYTDGTTATMSIFERRRFTRNKGNRIYCGTAIGVNQRILMSSDEFIEVWTPDGTGFNVQHWYPIETYPDGGELSIGRAEPVQQKKPEMVESLMKLLLLVRNNLKREALTSRVDNSCKEIFYKQADMIRDQLKQLGVTVEDNYFESKWKMT